MALSERFKSKKIRLGMVAIGVIIFGFFVFVFLNSSEPETEPRKTRSLQRTRSPAVSKPEKDKKEEETLSPLFETLKKWKDPFRKEDPEIVELQDKIDATKKKIEYLKASLEEKKLRKEIKELEKSMHQGSSTYEKETELKSPEKGTGESQPEVIIQAILITDDQKSALIVSGGKKSWVQEGEKFDCWTIKEIKKDRVFLLKAGKVYVFFYDRAGFSEEGRS